MSKQNLRRDTFRVAKLDFNDSAGSFEAKALLTRCGVFSYVQEDGTTLNELRHPDDVFDPASLASLKGVPVVIGHPAEIDPSNWKIYAVGHIGDDVRAEGSYVAATIRVNDGDAKEKVLANELLELSCGYTCLLVEDDGVYDGVLFNARQTGVRYNHVGMGPEGWGRAGPNVRIYADSSESLDISTLKNGSYVSDMTVKKTDNASNEETNTVSKEEFDRLRGELAAANAKLSEKQDSAQIAKEIRARIELESLASQHEVKFDSNDSDATIRVKVLAKVSPEINCDGESDDFVRAALKIALSKPATPKVDARTAEEMARVANPDAPKDAVGSKFTEAVEKSRKDAADRWKKPVGIVSHSRT